MCWIHKSATIIYVFKPLSSCFSFILCRIGAFDLFYYFHACAGCSMFLAHFRSGLVSKGQLQIIAVDSKRCREVPSSHEVKIGNYGDIGTGTKSEWYWYPSAVREPVEFWYRYHTNWYRY